MLGRGGSTRVIFGLIFLKNLDSTFVLGDGRVRGDHCDRNFFRVEIHCDFMSFNSECDGTVSTVDRPWPSTTLLLYPGSRAIQMFYI